MKKALNISLILGLLLVPSVTFAAWYNPFTWFKKTPVTIQTSVQTDPEAPKSTPEAIPTPKPIITNTITVEDPKLQAQINTLIKQNTDLQTQLVDLTTKYNVLVATNADLNKQIAATKIASETPTTTEVTVIKRPYTFTQSDLGYYVSYPLTLNNGGDKDVVLTGIEYGTISGDYGTNVTLTPRDEVGILPMNGTIDYRMTNSVVIPANGSATVYVNIRYSQNVLPLNLYQFDTNQTNIHFSF